jgi:thiol-disulfide isomerase/thioredoxin
MRRAIALPRTLITVDGPDGVVRVKDSIPTSAAAYALSLEGPVLRFATDKAHVRVLKVLDRPPVIGEIGLDALVADRLEYREGIKAYSPDKTAMDALKVVKKPIEVEAYFATWCSHCKMYMPKFLRVLKDAANPNIKLTLVGMPRGFGTEKGPWEGKAIQTIPTIIVKYEGKDVTRLSTHEGAVPEAELAGIISALK